MSRLVALLCLVGAAGLAHAADRPSIDSSRIADGVGEGATGAVAVNVAAGIGNVQANERSIAAGTQGLALASGAQRTDAAQGDIRRDAVAVIDGTAFSRTTGALGVNQAAGAANAQLNLLAIGAGPDAAAQFVQQVDNAVLAATAAPTARAGRAAGPQQGLREARIDGATALRDTQGVVQINQSAGVGNASVNAVVLQIPGGGP